MYFHTSGQKSGPALAIADICGVNQHMKISPLRSVSVQPITPLGKQRSSGQKTRQPDVKDDGQVGAPRAILLESVHKAVSRHGKQAWEAGMVGFGGILSNRIFFRRNYTVEKQPFYYRLFESPEMHHFFFQGHQITPSSKMHEVTPASSESLVLRNTFRSHVWLSAVHASVTTPPS